MAADISPLASLAPPVGRAGLDAFATIMVMALTAFWDVLPHLIQLFGAIAVLLTVWEKPTVQRLVARWRTRNSKGNDDATG